jgi:hypothetical protein
METSSPTAAPANTITIVYNGAGKPLRYNGHETVQAALEQAMNLFSITTNRHTYALFTEAGDELTELNKSLKAAGVDPGATLLLGPSRVRGGGR